MSGYCIPVIILPVSRSGGFIDRPERAREMRARIAETYGEKLLVFKENPMFSYFLDDDREDGELTNPRLRISIAWML